MNKFWNNLMLPIIESVNANYIVEIGSDTGLNTLNILEYCMDHDAHMTAIDPLPRFDIDEFKTKYGNKFEIYKELSLSRLPLMEDYDVTLIDGDHNWYTVYNELKIIEKNFKDKKFPLIFLHDVGWPYGRRDLYYNPENIPEAHRQPYKKLGIYPGETNLKEKEGINSSLCNSIYENNPHNGVLTAVEDFIQESKLKFNFHVINAFFGLGILYPSNNEIEKIVRKFIKKSNFLKTLEEERVKSAITYSKVVGQNNSLKKELNKKESEVDNIKNQIKTDEQLIKQKEKQVQEKDAQISSLKSDLYEIGYFNNDYRSFTQKLISRFPSLFILFNKDNKGIKNALINIKGYNAIKNNHLLDIGYYLKNNSDVRKSGADPILHYIYHGFKEGRKPNTSFDGNYYLKTYKDVQNSNLNPLVHYSLYGLKEERQTQINFKSQKKTYKTFKKAYDGISTNKNPIKVAFVVTEKGENVSAGDYFTALDFGEALEKIGWEISFLSRKGPENWYEIEEDVDILISLLPQYDPHEIKCCNGSLIKIAWPRNWFDKWASNSSLQNYNIIIASSKTACRYIKNKTGLNPILMPIGTNPSRFNSKGSVNKEYLCDYCFTGSYWNDPREIIEMLDPESIPYTFKLYGKNWDKIEELREYYHGFIDYANLPEVYSSTKIVIDDANRGTKRYGAVNSRVYDAISNGALVITNGEIGSKETFEGKLPVYRSKEELKYLIEYYLANEDARIMKVKELQKFVLENHTYDHRAQSLKDIVEKYVLKIKIAIKIPAPNWEEVQKWGDYYLALGLKKELEKKGCDVILQILPQWEKDDEDRDVVIVLRGLSRYKPKEQHFNIMWNISHPDDVDVEEYNQYDHVFIASEFWARKIAKEVDVPVESMLQCTDPELFYPDPDNKYKHDLLFVGNSRKVYRKIIRDLLPTEKDLAVYGTNWKGRIPDRYIKGEHIPNSELRKAYSSCKILLNDHWDDMMDKGFISNRLFDGFASGAFIISDKIKGTEEVFDDALVTYESPEELHDLIKHYLDVEKTANIRNTVIKQHTFKNRAEQILEVINKNRDIHTEKAHLNFPKRTNDPINSIIDSLDLNQSNYQDCDKNLSFYLKNDLKHENPLKNIERTSKIPKNYIRIFVITETNNSTKISKTLNSIQKIDKNLPVTIIVNSKSKTSLLQVKDHNVEIVSYESEGFLNRINQLVREKTEEFILFVFCGNELKEGAIESLKRDVSETVNDEKIAAVVFDDEIINSNNNTFSRFKPGFSPEYYLEHDYIENSVWIRRSVLIKIGGFNEGYEQNYIRDAVLRLWEQNYEILKKDFVGIKSSEKSKNLISNEDSERFLKDTLNRRQTNYELEVNGNSLRPIYDSKNMFASIIIPFKDHVDTTKKCIKSILKHTEYFNYEIILINNNSAEEKTKQYIDKIKENEKVRVLNYHEPFNYSKINNFAVKHARGNALIFLNNDMEVINSHWLTELIGDMIQPGIGAVGGLLYYPNKTIQHAGVVIGLNGLAGHLFAGEKEEVLPVEWIKHRRNVSAVTGACMAINKKTFERIGGFNEDFDITGSDVEICLRLLEYGYRNIINPEVKLFHHEKETRSKIKVRDKDIRMSIIAYQPYLKGGDPYFNKNFSLNSNNLIIKKEEYPLYKEFLTKYFEEKKQHHNRISQLISDNTNQKIENAPEGEVLIYDVSPLELEKNQVLMSKFKRNPKLQLNKALWFVPFFDHIYRGGIYTIFRTAQHFSIKEGTTNIIVLYGIGEREIEEVKNEVSATFPKLSFEIINLNKYGSSKDLPYADAAFCTFWTSAYHLVKYNNCKAKFYFNQDFEPMFQPAGSVYGLIEQTYRFGFIGITNTLGVAEKHRKYTEWVTHFTPSIDKNIYYPNNTEKDKLRIVFYGRPTNPRNGFRLGIEALRLVKAYFGDKVEILSVGSEFDKSNYGLDGVLENLGVLPTIRDVAELYRSCDVGLVFMFTPHPSYQPLEYMASGCVTVTNINESNLWLLRDKENVILTEPTVTSVANNIINVLENDVLRNTIIKNGLKTVSLTNWETELNKLCSFIKNPKIKWNDR